MYVGTRDADAGVASGSLAMQPALPGAGDTATGRHVPPATLARRGVLLVGARIRYPGDPAYGVGRAVAELATLRRDGDALTGRFVLPAGAVFGVRAVEDTAATVVDDYDGRGWEVLLLGRPGVPTLEALDQCAHDLIGRNREEGFATVRAVHRVRLREFGGRVAALPNQRRQAITREIAPREDGSGAPPARATPRPSVRCALLHARNRSLQVDSHRARTY